MYRYNVSERSGSYFIRHARRKATVSFVTRLSDTIMSWLDRARQRRHLAELDDRMLRDIGLSRADVQHETARHFWHE